MKKSSYILNIVLLLSFMTVTFTAKAQWNKWHFGGGVGSLTYYGDLSDKFVNANLQEIGYHAYVERLISKRSGIYLRLESVNGQLLGSDRAPKGWINGSGKYFERALNFRTEIHDVNTSMVFYFGSLKKRERAPFLNAYVRAGIGIGYYDVFGDLLDADGNNYNFWSDGTVRSLSENDPNASNAVEVSRDYDFETNLRKLDIEESNSRFKWQIPVGLGVKMRLSDAVSLILDAQYTYSMTDYIDNVGDKKTRSDITDPFTLYAADPAGYIGDRARNINSSVGMNDSYLYVSAGLTFNVGDNSKPKFKTPIYYPKTILPVKDTVDLDTIASIEIDTPQVEMPKKDSVLQNIIAPSSLSLKMRVDSVTLVKSQTSPNQYIIQYYLDVDSLQSEDAQLLYQKNILVTDTTQLPLIKDSIQYTSAETIIREATDSMQNVLITDTVMSSKDSVVMMIQQLKLQLDQLQEKVAPSDSVKIKSDSVVVSKDSIIKPVVSKKDSTAIIQKVDSIPSKSTNNKVQVVDSDIDSIVRSENMDTITKVLVPIADSAKVSTVNKKVNFKDSTSVQQLVIDSTLKATSDTNQVEIFKFSPVKSKTNDSVKAVINAPIDSTVSKKTSAEISKTEIIEPQAPVILKDTVVLIDSSSGTLWKDSVVIYYKQIENLNQQIEELQNQLSVKKDSIVAANIVIDSSALKAIPLKMDTIVPQSPIIQRDTVVLIDSTSSELWKDSVKYYNQQQEHLKHQIEELQNQLFTKKDSVVSPNVQIDSSALKSSQAKSNQTIEDLKKQIEALENTSKLQKDSIQNKEVEISQLKSIPRDTVKLISPDTSVKKIIKDIPSQVDTMQQYYERQQEDLKKQIEDLQNQLESKNEQSNLRVASVDTTSKIKENPAVDPAVEALQLKIQELEMSSKAKTDSLNLLKAEKTKSLQESSDVAKKIVPTTVIDSTSDSLQLRIAALESQLSSAKLAQSKTAVDSLGAFKNETPNVTLSPNVSIGNSKRRKFKSIDADSTNTDFTSSNSKTKKEKEGIELGFDYNDKPGFFEARKQKKEGKEILASDKMDTTVVKDSLAVKLDSNGNAISIEDSTTTTVIAEDSLKVAAPEEKIIDNDLQVENEILKNQISNIQKNQDSLIAVISRLVDKNNQPVVATEPKVIEKEVQIVQKLDSSAIIESILNQPSTKVFFAVGKSNVSTQYKSGLDQLAAQLSKYPILNIRLKGFADPTGNAAANLKLSENRANSVKTYLIQTHNVSPERIIVLPAGQEENSDDMSYSRRVEVQLVK